MNKFFILFGMLASMLGLGVAAETQTSKSQTYDGALIAQGSFVAEEGPLVLLESDADLWLPTGLTRWLSGVGRTVQNLMPVIVPVVAVAVQTKTGLPPATTAAAMQLAVTTIKMDSEDRRLLSADVSTLTPAQQERQRGVVERLGGYVGLIMADIGGTDQFKGLSPAEIDARAKQLIEERRAQIAADLNSPDAEARALRIAEEQKKNLEAKEEAAEALESDAL